MNLFSPRTLLITVFLFVSPLASASAQDDSLFQYSTINSLLDGYYDGDLSFSSLGEHGNFGLGTFNHLDGEMIELDGRFYQIKTDGKVYPVDSNRFTPFAVVTYFDVDQSRPLPASLDYPALQKELRQLVTNKNHFYAFRIHARLDKLTVRSVPAQTRPYPPLVEVVQNQVKFHYSDQEGTLVGFYTPDYMKGLNVPGFHFHFLSKDHNRGGHVLALQTGAGLIEIDEIHKMTMSLPQAGSFAELNLVRDRKEAIDKVEKNH